jgi:hypothetical protein
MNEYWETALARLRSDLTGATLGEGKQGSKWGKFGIGQNTSAEFLVAPARRQIGLQIFGTPSNSQVCIPCYDIVSQS